HAISKESIPSSDAPFAPAIANLGSFSCVLLCYNQGLSSPSVRVVSRRGVAQPGRAPGSGPGGRRFKSSLPDQSFQRVTSHFWCAVYIDVDDFVTVMLSLTLNMAVSAAIPLNWNKDCRKNRPS